MLREDWWSVMGIINYNWNMLAKIMKNGLIPLFYSNYVIIPSLQNFLLTIVILERESHEIYWKGFYTSRINTHVLTLFVNKACIGNHHYWNRCIRSITGKCWYPSTFSITSRQHWRSVHWIFFECIYPFNV